jgi:hypothetical protein
MHVATVLVNDQRITSVVTERGVAPVAQLDPGLPADPVELQSKRVWSRLVDAVNAADDDLFVPVETVTFVD